MPIILEKNHTLLQSFYENELIDGLEKNNECVCYYGCLKAGIPLKEAKKK